MTLPILLVLGILGAALVLFVSEWLRMDVVALLVLGTLALTGLVSPPEALAGFSNPAVITVWAMFMLSAGLARTGVADVIGRQIFRLAGGGETRLVAAIMLTGGVLSAFMNNIGVAALLLPVVMDLARRAGRPASRLLMPLAYGTLLGGLTTLIGTPPNLLVAEALGERGLAPFRLFDYTPVGVAAMASGIAFVALVGRRWLPAREAGAAEVGAGPRNLPSQYGLQERAVVLRVGSGSALVGRTLEGSRLGSAAGLNVFAVIRDGRTLAAPGPAFLLRAGDRLLVAGRLDRFAELRGWREFEIDPGAGGIGQLVSPEAELAELRVSPGSPLAGQTLGQADFRGRFGAIVLALGRGAEVLHSNLATTALRADDRLLALAPSDRLADLAEQAELERLPVASAEELVRAWGLKRRIFTVRVPADSVLVGRSLAASRLGDAFRLGVLGVIRDGVRRLLPDPEEELVAGDRLIVRGEREDLEVLRALQRLSVESETPQDLQALESDQIGLAEAIVSPRAAIAGRTLRELRFRERFGLQVLAIFRDGRAWRSELRDLPLRFGDALLLFGSRDRLLLLAHEPDLLLLAHGAQEPPRRAKAPLAAGIMAAALATVLLGWLPIAIAAVIGATTMVLTRCLTMEEAYRSVEWRSIFLIAGMLPLGVAMQETGAAAWVAGSVLEPARAFGPWGTIVALYAITALATSVVPTAALVVLMAPIVLGASAEAGISPYAAMMAVAMAASASFTSPVSHPANVLVMGPGGYRFVDYVKLGIPLTVVVAVVVLLVLPLFWPLGP